MLQFILDRHLPYAAVALDRHWNLLLENCAASQFFSALTSPELSLSNRRNVLRLTFHPEGSRRWIVNWPEVERYLLSRAELVLGSAEDTAGASLLAEIRSYASSSEVADSHTSLRAGDLLLPLHIRTADFDLRVVSTIMTLCRPHDVTLQELRVETWFPADQESERCWRQNFGECASQTYFASPGCYPLAVR